MTEWKQLIGKKVRVVWHDGSVNVGVLIEVVGRVVTIRTAMGGRIGATARMVEVCQ